MSEKHLYEKHLAEKLQQLSPPPDMEQHWQEMKALLDDDRPRGGWIGKRWWRLGVIAGLLLIGTWIVETQFFSTSIPDSQLTADGPKPANVEDKKLSPDNRATAREQKVAGNGNDKTPAVSDGGTVVANDPVQPPAVAATEKAKANNSFSELNRSLKEGTNPDNTIDDKSAVKSSPIASGEKISSGKKDREKVTYGVDVGNDDDKTSRNNPSKNRHQYKTNPDTKDDITVHSNKNTDAKNTNTPDISTPKPVDYSPLRENTSYVGSTPAPADKLKTDFSSLNLRTTETLKSKSARSGKMRSAKTFSIGFSLPLAFPLGDQKALSYNFNAGANTVSDFLPAPHLQYRLNTRTYLQTEVQFISPQYIRPILLYEQRTQAGNYLMYNSIYARKLYYFNVPVGIHHSPFANFYLGTGLQFSTLLSGVGLYEETKRSMSGQPISLVGERYARLSGDSLSNRMNSAEVRLMLEMNYYYNRFTFGLRYNQAFNNYVDFRIDNMSPYTFDKNKALQFYLRYNLWENMQRRNNKGLLSSK